MLSANFTFCYFFAGRLVNKYNILVIDQTIIYNVHSYKRG
jgi:hypothetical protein